MSDQSSDQPLNQSLNTVWRLARQPTQGHPQPSDFVWSEEPLPEVAADQILTRTIYLSLDPYQWGRRRSGTEQPGEVCHGRTVARVVRSRHADYAEGDYVFGTNGWQGYGLSGAGVSIFGYMRPRRVDPTQAPIATAVGVLGMLGLTAYSGLMVQCKPQAGETVVVSAASGGVGQVVAQLARLAGARVVGIAGGADKCEYVTNMLGADACVSHRDANYPQALAAACPDGIDVYFENVGGPVFAAVLPLLNQQARICVCGLISQYGNMDGKNPKETWQAAGAARFAEQRVQVHDLFVGNFVDDYQGEFLERMGAWVAAGEIRYQQDIWPGLESAPEAFATLLQGGNFGKTLIQVSTDPSADPALDQRCGVVTHFR